MTKRQGKSGTIDVKALLREDEEFLRALVRAALQEVLEAEMTEALGAEKGERAAGRQGYRSGYYGRTLITRVGKLELRVPQERTGRFSTELFERYQVGHLERLPLGTPYPAIVAHVGRLLTKLPGGPELVIDFTGVGRPIFDMFVYSGISPIGVLITGGTAETRDGPTCSVPKLTLVSRLPALLHEGRLKILRELAEAETLVRELQDFRVEFTAAGHLTFNARCGKHDDLVLALAIAVWRAHGGGVASWGMFELTRQRALGSAASEPRYFVGVDLGQSRDPTAIAVVRRVEPPGPVSKDDSGLSPKPNYAPGSVEWQEEQRRCKNDAASG